MAILVIPYMSLRERAHIRATVDGTARKHDALTYRERYKALRGDWTCSHLHRSREKAERCPETQYRGDQT